MLGIEILVKNYPPTACLNDYIHITIFYSGFWLAKIKRQDSSLECTPEIENLLESEEI